MLPQSFPIQKELLLSHNGPVHTKEMYKSRDHFWSGSNTPENKPESPSHSAGEEQDAFQVTTSLTCVTERNSVPSGEKIFPRNPLLHHPLPKALLISWEKLGITRGVFSSRGKVYYTSHCAWIHQRTVSHTRKNLKSKTSAQKRQWHRVAWKCQLRDFMRVTSGYFTRTERIFHLSNLAQNHHEFRATYQCLTWSVLAHSTSPMCSGVTHPWPTAMVASLGTNPTLLVTSTKSGMLHLWTYLQVSNYSSNLTSEITSFTMKRN